MKKEYLIIVGSVLATTLVVFLLIIPAWGDLGFSMDSILQLKLDLKEAEEFNILINDLNRQINSDPKAVEKLLFALPKEQERPDLLIQLETLASVQGLVMESVDFSEVGKKIYKDMPQSAEEAEIFPKTTDPESPPLVLGNLNSSAAALSYKTLLVRMRLKGNITAFKNYLKAVEDNRRIMDVTLFDLANMSDSDTMKSSSFGIQLYVYYQ